MILTNKNWSDISLSQYQELKSLKSNYESFDGDYEYLIQQISIVYDIDSEHEIFYNITMEEIFDIIRNIKWIEKDPPSNSTQKNIKGLSFKSLNKITIYEFIDCEKYSGDDSKEFDENFHIILSILFRNEKENNWSHLQEEPYEYDKMERSKLFLDLPITHVYGLKNEYLSFKQEILDSYPLVFPEPDKVDFTGLDEREIREIKQELKRLEDLSKFSWLNIIYELAKGDITKYEGVGNTKLITALNTLTMIKVLGKDLPSID